jgi:hypothetical protein
MQPPPAQNPPADPRQPEPRQGRGARQPRTSDREQPASSRDPFDEPRISRVAGPTRTELTVSANFLGGYDDNLTAGLGTGSAISPSAMTSGSTGYVNATLNYLRANSRRSLKVDTVGTLQGYPGYIDHPAAGGAATIDGMARAGHSLTFNASERVGYEPFFNVFSPGASSAPLPPGAAAATPVTGLFERRSWNSNSVASIDRRWSRNDSTSLSYSYRVQQYTDNSYGDSNEHNAQAEYRHRLANGIRARGTYRFVDREYSGSDGRPLPTRENRIEAGPDIDKSLSRRRTVKFSLTAGAAYVESISSTTRQQYQNWVPTGTFRTTFAFSPTSSLDGGYQRDFQDLQGVTNEVYTTDTAFMNVGGLVTARTELRVGATYSNWQTPQTSGVNETLNVYGGSVRLNVKLGAKTSASVDYYYYHQTYSDPASLPAGFPADYDRHAVRVGLAFWLPIKGSPNQPTLSGR